MGRSWQRGGTATTTAVPLYHGTFVQRSTQCSSVLQCSTCSYNYSTVHYYSAIVGPILSCISNDRVWHCTPCNSTIRCGIYIYICYYFFVSIYIYKILLSLCAMYKTAERDATDHQGLSCDCRLSAKLLFTRTSSSLAHL